MAIGRKTGGKVALYSKVEIVCPVCNKTFTSQRAHKNYLPKYCCQDCYFKRNVTSETREKQSAAKKGKKPWNYGVHMWADKPHPRGTLGMKIVKPKMTEETRMKLVISHRGLKYEKNSGSNHWNWRNGISPINERIRHSAEYKNWRRLVFERDDYTCQLCGIRGSTLHADHIIPFSADESKRFDVDNGRTLCADCHRKTPTYGVKVLDYA